MKVLHNYVDNFCVGTLRTESDHCPLLFTLNIKPGLSPQVNPNPPGYCMKYYKWDTARIFKYFEELTSDIACEKLADFLCMINSEITAEEACENFYNYLEHAIKNTFCECSTHTQPKKRFPVNHWFDDECKIH